MNKKLVHFNKPPYSGNEQQFISQAISSNKISGGGSFGEKWGDMKNQYFNPVFNQIHFYDKPDATTKPLLVASLSKPIEKINDTTFIIEVQLDF